MTIIAEEFVDANEEAVLHDRPHIEIMFDALEESVAGVEGITQAQHYAYGVLSANSMITTQQRRDGNEGFFSAVGGGAKAIYDYVVKMFKSLWDFFFSRDAGKLADKAEGELKEAQADIAAVSTGGSSEAQTTALFTKMKHTVNGLEKVGVDIKTVEDLDTFMLEAEKGSIADKKAAIIHVSKELPKVNHKAQRKLEGVVEGITKRVHGYLTYLEEAKAESEKAGEKGKFIRSMFKMGGDTFIKISKDLITDLGEVKTLTDVNKAKAHAANALGYLKEIRESTSNMKRLRAEIQSDIDKVKKVVDAGNPSEEDKEKLAGLRAAMVFATGMARHTKTALNDLTEFQSATNKVFGV